MTRLRCGRNLIFPLNRLMENQPRREPSLEELESAFGYGCSPAKAARPPPVGLATGSLGLATGLLGLATGSLGLAIRAGVTTACRDIDVVVHRVDRHREDTVAS